jgi:hypothetical protein
LRPANFSPEPGDHIVAEDQTPLIYLASVYYAQFILRNCNQLKKFMKMLSADLSKASDRLCSRSLLPGVALYAMK